MLREFQQHQENTEDLKKKLIGIIKQQQNEIEEMPQKDFEEKTIKEFTRLENKINALQKKLTF